ncbi:hypothetical protein Hypma_003007 [Hypsizygus marmoreus]|uniref:Nuclear pore complex protein n=1 Tax=Hypsizygus marmoreus TaxID=39966 RepID=A0A369JBM7_HYPMA|nr:hypothetical protein Hypma_003007 [Hypsizygus marmoreus]
MLQVLLFHGLFPTSPTHPRMTVSVVVLNFLWCSTSVAVLNFYQALFERSCNAQGWRKKNSGRKRLLEHWRPLKPLLSQKGALLFLDDPHKALTFDVPSLSRPPADHAFHFSQLHIILDRTGTLLDVFANGLHNGSYSKASFEYATMCRFFAHLCLFLQMIDILIPPMATQVILESYLQVLEAAGQRKLIAMLDMDRVAIAATERMIEKVFDLLPPMKGPLPSIIALQPSPTDAELFLLCSIEWTTTLQFPDRKNGPPHLSTE